MMTYGWGILVVLVAGILLWQMGFLELSRNVTPDKRGFAQVTPLDWSFSPEGKLTVVVQNNAGTIVSLDSVTAIMTTGGVGTCNNVLTVLPINEFRPGSTQKIEVQDCPVESGIKIGDYYRVNLTVGYTNPSSGLPHKSNGVIWGPVG